MIKKVRPPSERESRVIQYYLANQVSKREAYEIEYNKDGKKTQKQCSQNASALFNRPAVIAELQRIKERQNLEFDWKVVDIKKKLADIVTMCLKVRIDAQGNQVPVDPKAAISALSELNKMEGNLAPTQTKSEITGKDGAPIQYQERKFTDFYAIKPDESTD